MCIPDQNANLEPSQSISLSSTLDIKKALVFTKPEYSINITVSNIKDIVVLKNSTILYT